MYVHRFSPLPVSTAIIVPALVATATLGPLASTASVVNSSVRVHRRAPVAASSPIRSRHPCDLANSASTTPSRSVEPHSRALPRRYDQRFRPVAGSRPATRSVPVATAVGPSTGPPAAVDGTVHNGRTLAGSGAVSGGSGLSAATWMSVVKASLDRTNGTATTASAPQPGEGRRRGDGGPGAHPGHASRAGGDPVQGDLGQPAAVGDGRQVGLVRLAPPVGRRAGVEQPQPAGRGAVPRDVAVPEDEHVGVGEAGGAARLPAGGRAGLVHDGEAQPAEGDPGDLGQPGPQRGTVVVADDRDQPGRAPLQRVQQRHVHPVTGVQHDVRLVDRRPHLGRQVPRPLGHVRVGQDQQPYGRRSRHPAARHAAPRRPAAAGVPVSSRGL